MKLFTELKTDVYNKSVAGEWKGCCIRTWKILGL